MFGESVFFFFRLYGKIIMYTALLLLCIFGLGRKRDQYTDRIYREK